MNENLSEKRSKEAFFTKPLIIIYVTVFIDLVGFGIVIPLLPFYGETFNASPFEVEMIFAVYSAMQFLFAPLLGSLSDKYGRRSVLFLSLIGSGIGYLFIGYATVLWMVFAGRIIAGITGGNISAAQAYIADVTAREDRAKGMGIFGAMFGLGFVFGPAIGGLLSRYGIHAPFIFAAALTFLNALALYFFLPETRKNTENKQSIKLTRFSDLVRAFEDRNFLTVTLLYFLVVTAFSIMTASFTLYTINRFGYNAEQNGYLFFYVGILAIIFQGFIFNKLVSVFGEPKLVAIGCLLLVASLFAIPYIGPVSGGLIGLLIGIAFISIGNALSSPALTSLGSKLTNEEDQGRALGTMQSAASLARAIGPVIGGLLLNNSLNKIDDHTIQRTFWTASAIMLIAFLVSLYFAKVASEEILV
ncbi:MAG: MFS transporter [Pyrinomonadaceae bacterium]